MTRFEVVFVRNRQRKTKKWEDGTLGVSTNGNKATLYDSNGGKLDVVMINGRVPQIGDELITERNFEVTIESFKDEEQTTPDQRAPEPAAVRAPPTRGINYGGNRSKPLSKPLPSKRTVGQPAGRATFSLRKQFRPPTRSGPPAAAPPAAPDSQPIDVDDLPPRFGGTGRRSEPQAPPPWARRDDRYSGIRSDAAAARKARSVPSLGVTQASKRLRSDATILQFLDQTLQSENSPGDAAPAAASPLVSEAVDTRYDGYSRPLDTFVQEKLQEPQKPVARLPYSVFLEEPGEEDDMDDALCRELSIDDDPPSGVTSYPPRPPVQGQSAYAPSPPPPLADEGGQAAIVSSPVRSSRPARRLSLPLNRGFVPPGSTSSEGVPAGRAMRPVDVKFTFPGRPPPGKPIPRLQRSATISPEFSTLVEYRSALLTALVEVLNLQLADVSGHYHSLLATLNLAEYSGLSRTPRQRQQAHQNGPQCAHGPAKLVSVQKESANKGRLFYTCPKGRSGGCNFFKWADEVVKNDASGAAVDRRITVTSAEILEQVCRASQIMLHAECSVQPEKRKRRDGTPSKTFFIRLDRRGRGSDFSKRDVWVVSSSVYFEPAVTVVAESVFFGPSSEGDIELRPLSRPPFSTKVGTTLFAINVVNAQTELTCIDALQTGLSLASVPLLPTLISPGKQAISPPQLTGREKCRAPLALAASRADIDELASGFVTNYHLNQDQATALRRFSRMLPCGQDCKDGPADTAEPVLLVHGVFGSGKSYFLAVLVLFLTTAIEQFADPFAGVDGEPGWAVLISSGTNVAVDRILTSLLEQGFTDFVRVGSARKIAPVIMPHSTHGSEGSDKKELTQLRSMMNEPGLSSQERAYISSSIEKLKMGVNRDLLKKTKVVAATLAATGFACLEDFRFPIIVLDEACQMTEPSAVVPLTRFACQALVMVGDPKQLPPTIPGPEAAHPNGLEQSLFERLMKTANAERYHMLRIQYRCHPHISAMANKFTYGGELVDGVSAEDRRALVSGLAPACFFDCDNGNEERQGSGSYINQREAEFVVSMVGALLEAEVVHFKQIGVISTYKAQSHLIEQMLRDSPAPNSKLVTSSTVDAFQGGERDIIFLSCVRTKGMGFIADSARTNVAMTRGKRHLFVVGKYRNLLQHASAAGPEGSQLWQGVLSHFSELEGGRMKAASGLSHLRELIEAANMAESCAFDDESHPIVGASHDYDGGNGDILNETPDSDVFLHVVDEGARDDDAFHVESEEALAFSTSALPVRTTATPGSELDLGISALLDDDDNDELEMGEQEPTSKIHNQPARAASSSSDGSQQSVENPPRSACHSRQLQWRERRARKPMIKLPDFNFSEDEKLYDSSDDTLQTPPQSFR